MIKKEDIKVGIVFTLCEKREKDEKGWILHSIASGGFGVLLKDKVDLPVLFKIVDIKDNSVTIETIREFFVMGNSHNTIFGKLEEQWTTTRFCFNIEEFNRIITETGKKWLPMEEIIDLYKCASNLSEETVKPLEDALLDCANYCILTLMEYQKRKEHGTD